MRLLFGVFAVLALTTAPASSEPLSSHAHRAAELCKAGDYGQAHASLVLLHRGLLFHSGPDADTSQLVALALAKVERSLPVLPSSPAAAASAVGELDPELEASLSALRACIRATPNPTNALLASCQGDVVSNHQAARDRMRQGQPKAALVAARCAAGMGGDGELPETLALIHYQLGDLQASRSAARGALDAAPSVARRIAMLRLLVAVGDLGQALERLESFGEVQEPGLVAEIEGTRGDLASRLGQPADAREHYQLALLVLPEGASLQRAGLLQRIGAAAREAGDLRAALDAYREALKLRIALQGETHIDVARLHNELGVLRGDFSAWQDANSLFERSLAVLQAELGAGHPEVATVVANQALARWRTQRDKAAADGYSAAADGLERAYGVSHPVVGEARRTLARIDEERGNIESAASGLMVTLTAQRLVLGDAHPRIAATRLALARVFIEQDKGPDATAEAEAAFAVLREAYGGEHPLVARARVVLARAHAISGEWVSADRQARLALDGLGKHIRRSFRSMPVRQRRSLAGSVEEAVSVLLSAHGTDPQATYLALVPLRDPVLRSLTPTRTGSERGASAELRSLRAKYVAAVLDEENGTENATRELARRIDREEEAIAKRSAAVRAPAASELFAQACTRLDRRDGVLEFVGYTDQQSEARRYAVFLIGSAAATGSTGCTVERFDLANGRALDEQARAVADRMRRLDQDAKEQLAALGRGMREPFSRAAARFDRWWLVPDGPLWTVPFAALPAPGAPDDFLIESITLGTISSLSDLVGATSNRGKGVLLFGGPDFGTAGAEGPRVLTNQGPCSLDPFTPLAGAAREIRELEKQLPSARVVSGEGATKAGFLEAIRGHPRLIHIATHAYYADECSQASEDDPSGLSSDPLLLSGVAFAGANVPSGDGGSAILTAFEAASLDLSGTDLIVLSACDTGAGATQSGEEVLGLRWGFRAAGARALVTSLWLSNDFATKQIMAAFYRELLGGNHGLGAFHGAAALREAQLKLVASGRRLNTRNPSVWANFVFSGTYEAPNSSETETSAVSASTTDWSSPESRSISLAKP